jgi:hypothetical protein
MNQILAQKKKKAGEQQKNKSNNNCVDLSDSSFVQIYLSEKRKREKDVAGKIYTHWHMSTHWKKNEHTSSSGSSSFFNLKLQQHSPL